MQVPDNYLPIMPYLIVPGAYRFLDFVKDVFGATLQYSADRSPGILMHGELRIGPAVIMFADATDVYAPFPSSMFLYVDKVDEVFAKALVRPDVTLLQELDNRPYGRGGGFKDAFGNAWWVNSPV
ncbi:VOC family protein [Dinghuibacter silviterrae]|uniref:Putative glyoxalase superfamily protein PhnB n=1 Tax=Dinghuibacter silviterrae TaxID=1539049 RepID=A0A4R8DX72_9BACT|nr:VOC family protein [Dinghuibacter silviterrae]TDX01811.1 putative glyoxalase superfamily protein PhnB [Dinghuibacter silviterrae]